MAIDIQLPVQVTDSALREVKEIMTKKNIPEGYGLRMGMKGGGCGGMSYLLGFDKKREGDNEYQLEGVPVYIEKRHLMFLLGVQLDFYDEADGRGFTFIQNQQKSSSS